MFTQLGIYTKKLINRTFPSLDILLYLSPIIHLFYIFYLFIYLHYTVFLIRYF